MQTEIKESSKPNSDGNMEHYHPSMLASANMLFSGSIMGIDNHQSSIVNPRITLTSKVSGEYQMHNIFLKCHRHPLPSCARLWLILVKRSAGQHSDPSTVDGTRMIGKPSPRNGYWRIEPFVTYTRAAPGLEYISSTPLNFKKGWCGRSMYVGRPVATDGYTMSASARTKHMRNIDRLYFRHVKSDSSKSTRALTPEQIHSIAQKLPLITISIHTP